MPPLEDNSKSVISKALFGKRCNIRKQEKETRLVIGSKKRTRQDKDEKDAGQYGW